MAGIPIVGPALGAAAAAAVGVMTSLNIAKIKKQKYNGGSSDSSTSTPSTISTPSQPNTVTMFKTQDNGTVNPTKTIQSSEANTSSREQTIKAVVSWSDIDAVSNMEDSVQNQMQL